MDNSAKDGFSPLVIGISGISNGGKTTLCEKLIGIYPNATIIHQDQYFREEKYLTWVPEVNHANWDELKALDNEALLNDVIGWFKKPVVASGTAICPLLIIEGFLIFNHKPLLKYFTKKYFLTLSFEESFRRRNTRIYEPPDPLGYFEKVVYPMYLKNKDEMVALNDGDIDYLDGMSDPNEILNQVVNEIERLLSTRR